MSDQNNNEKEIQPSSARDLFILMAYESPWAISSIRQVIIDKMTGSDLQDGIDHPEFLDAQMKANKITGDLAEASKRVFLRLVKERIKQIQELAEKNN